MQQKWWQQRFVWLAGIFGGVVIVLMPLLGGLFWRLFQPIAYPREVLFARDAPMQAGFMGVNLLGNVLILLIFGALFLLVQYHREAKLMVAVRGATIGWAVWGVFAVIWPPTSMASVISADQTITVRALVSLIIVMLLAVSFYQIGLQYGRLDHPALNNVWRLVALLMILFSILRLGVQAMGLPLIGVIDQLFAISSVLAPVYTAVYIVRDIQA